MLEDVPEVAGLALAEGNRPIDILKHQVLRFQYPSPYSLSSQVRTARARLAERSGLDTGELPKLDKRTFAE